MPPARFFLLIGIVIVAAALTIWGGALIAAAASAPTGWALLPLVAVALGLALRWRS